MRECTIWGLGSDAHLKPIAESVIEVLSQTTFEMSLRFDESFEENIRPSVEILQEEHRTLTATLDHREAQHSIVQCSAAWQRGCVR